MEKRLLPDLSAKERLETLENSADQIDANFGYTKPFTPEQITIFKDELSTSMIDLNAIEEEFKAIKEEYKLKMQPLKAEVKDLLKNIKLKAEYTKEKCFVFIEGDSAGYYNAEGELVYQRPLLPGERQKTIFSVAREGTND